MRRIALILICACALSARAAEGDEPVRPRFGLDLGFLGGVEPLHGNLPDDVAFLYGGDLKMRLTFVSLGVRLEKSAEFSSRNITFTRWLGTVGFNIGAGDRTEISPYFGFGKMLYGSALQPDEVDGRLGLELEHFFARWISFGAGIAFDGRLYDSNGVQTAGSLSGTLKLSVHAPFG
ncbi:MAG: hypothetical protein ACJ79C_07410 [Myxococcales bacterium]